MPPRANVIAATIAGAALVVIAAAAVVGQLQLIFLQQPRRGPVDDFHLGIFWDQGVNLGQGRTAGLTDQGCQRQTMTDTLFLRKYKPILFFGANRGGF
jgi:hypothetical protein